MVSHYQGMIETFDWYRCALGYKSLRFWTFSLLTILKKEGEEKEFERIASNYKAFFKTPSLLRFRKYYFDRKSRAFIRNIIGEKITAKLRRW